VQYALYMNAGLRMRHGTNESHSLSLRTISCFPPPPPPPPPDLKRLKLGQRIYRLHDPEVCLERQRYLPARPSVSSADSRGLSDGGRYPAFFNEPLDHTLYASRVTLIAARMIGYGNDQIASRSSTSIPTIQGYELMAARRLW